MQRRYFIQAGTLGFLAIATPLSGLLALTTRHNRPESWLQTFIANCQAKPAPIDSLSESLQEAVQASFTHFAEAGFSPLQSHVFLAGDAAQFCLCPLVSQPSPRSQQDMLLPIFYLNPAGQWVRTAVLDTFMLEAWAKADATPAQMLPIGYGQKDDAVGYLTLGGMWRTKTHMADNTATTELSVYNHFTQLYAERTVSSLPVSCA